MGYTRFVVGQRDPDSGRLQGLFQAAYALEKSGEICAEQSASLRRCLRWFNLHLPRPSRFTRKRNDSHRRPRALSWFRDGASAHLLRIQEVATLLEAGGRRVQVLRTGRPGYVVYEDEFQVVAEPFADTFPRPGH